MVATSKSARLLLLVLTLMLGLAWAGNAHAQSAFEDQYGSQVSSGEEAIESANSSASASAAAGAAPGGGTIGLLPSTGGPLLPFVAIGALGLGSVGLLALRRRGAQQRDT